MVADYQSKHPDKLVLTGRARIYSLDPVACLLACTVGVLVGYLLWGGSP